MKDYANSSENRSGNPRLAGVIKTSIWLCVFITIGWLIAGPFFKGKPIQSNAPANVPASAPVKQNAINYASNRPAINNAASSESGLVGYDNPRIKGLEKEYPSVSFADLSDFEYYLPESGATPDPERIKKNKIPDQIKAFNGRKVSVAGFMMPLDQDQDGATEFVLNGNYDMCGFGGPISINQWMMVKYTGKGKVPFTHLPMILFGTLEVGEEYKDGHLNSIYRLKAKAASTVDGLIE